MKLNLLKMKWTILRSRIYLHNMKPSGYLLPIIIFLLTTLTLVNYYHLLNHTDYWDNFNPANGNAYKYCEFNRMDSIIRQPANTWSNLAFLLTGLFTFSIAIHDYRNKGRRDSQNFLVRYPLFTVMYSVASIYLFIGSFFFHASLISFFQIIDQTGMYAIVSMVFVFNLYKLFPQIRLLGKVRSSHGYAMLLAFLFNFIIFQFIGEVDINLLFPVVVLIIAFSGFLYTRHHSSKEHFTRYMFTSFTVLVIAGCIWILDRTHTLCNPKSVFQGHALWHILCATSILFIYLYYRSSSEVLSDDLVPNL